MFSTPLISSHFPGFKFDLPGVHGGNVIAQGTADEIKLIPESITGQYLSGKKKIVVPKKRRKSNGRSIEIVGASEHNLKNVNVKFLSFDFRNV